MSRCGFVSHICVIKCVNRTFGAKIWRKWFVLLCQKGVRKVCVCGYFSQCLFFHWVVKLHLFCGGLCIFSVSAFSIFSVLFFFINVPL